jgi:hypothetical protein
MRVNPIPFRPGHGRNANPPITPPHQSPSTTQHTPAYHFNRLQRHPHGEVPIPRLARQTRPPTAVVTASGVVGAGVTVSWLGGCRSTLLHRHHRRVANTAARHTPE